LALRRGFKAEAERIATDVWTAMDLEPSDALDAVALAQHVGCSVHAADELVSIDRLRELYDIQSNAFFACTIPLPNGSSAVVYNPLMPDSRRNSDVSHEVAHILLDHSLSRLERIGNVSFLSCDKAQEDEASWLSGCLLLPRPALVHDLKKRRSHATIAEQRVLSIEMVEYRIRVTGAARQLAASRRKRKS